VIPVKGDQRAIRRMNRGTILNLLRREGQLSRAQLGVRSGLSGAAVTTVVAELLRDELLVEHATGTSTGGRPPVYLTINPEKVFAVGIKLMPEHLTAVVTNISIEARERLDYPIADMRPGAVLDAVGRATRKLLKQAGCGDRSPLGVGIGMPGIIDFRRGVCVESPLLGWRDEPIGERLEKALGCPVFVDNDVNAFAEAERLFGRGRQASNFVLVTVGRGVGAGLVINGRTYRGQHGGAGDFGHMPLQGADRTCVCGRQGCLEAYASEPAMQEEFRRRSGARRAPGVARLVELAETGDPVASAILADGGSRLGTAVAALARLVDPELIVISGEGTRLGRAYFDPMHRSLRAHGIGDGSRAGGIEVVMDPWNDDTWACGAAGLVVGETFNSGLQ